MNFLNLLIDFIFPQSPKTIRLEALSVEEILGLPPANKLTENIIAIFDYQNPLAKEIIWELKYKGDKILADRLGAILYDVILHELTDIALFDSVSWRNNKILLIPIPISNKRRLERGWNQAELLAEKIVSLDTQKLFEYSRALIKTRHTESQTHSSRSERLKNLENSMKVSDVVLNRCAILIDDVITTGSTFAEAKRALKEAGVEKVLCVAVAH